LKPIRSRSDRDLWRNRFLGRKKSSAQIDSRSKGDQAVIAYIGGKAAREGTRFSHAGAIIEGGRRHPRGEKVKLCVRRARRWSMRSGELPDAVVRFSEIKGESLMTKP